MKVLFVNLVYGTGSTGRIIADIMALLRESGHDAKAFYGNGPRSDDPDAVKFSGKLGYYFDNGLSRFTDHAGWYSRTATRRLIREIRSFRPDVIHLHTLHGFYVHCGMLFRFLKRAGIPVVWTLHDCWAFTGHCTHFSSVGCDQWKTLCTDCAQLRRYPQCYLRGDVRRNYLRKKKTFTGVEHLTLTAPSAWLREQIRCSFLSDYPVEVIPNGIDTSVFSPQSGDVRGRFGLQGKKIVLGVASAWSEKKGLRDLIALSERLGNAARVVMIGLTEAQLRTLPDAVLGIPRTADLHELAQWYSAADVFVNPTYEETFGLTTVEAQACGAPVVVYATDGCPETVAPGNSVLVPRGDLAALEQAVRAVLRDGHRADPEQMRPFEKNRVYARYLSLYERMLSAVRSRP